MASIFILIGAGLIFLFIKKRNNGKHEQDQAALLKKIPNPLSGDALIHIQHVTLTDLRNAINGYLDMYEHDGSVLPRLTHLTDTDFILTFPKGIDTESLCVFINYLQYPTGLTYSPEILGWATADITDTWVTDKAAGKKNMFFIPEDDKEYDTVYMTTEDNIGFNLGFSVNGRKRLTYPKKMFIPPAFTHVPADKKSEDFH